MFVLLYGLLLISNNRHVDSVYIHLADDLPKFNNFPWGNVEYEFLVSSMKNYKEYIDRQLARGRSVRFQAYGFTYAVQVFQFEVHAGVVELCALPNAGFGGSFPRML